MKIFANKNIWKRIVIILLPILVLSFTTPPPVSAEIGGVLMSPIISLFVGLADGINTVIQTFFLSIDQTIFTVSDGVGFWGKVGITIGLKLVNPILGSLYALGNITDSKIIQDSLGLILGLRVLMLTSLISPTGAVINMKTNFQRTAAVTSNMFEDKTTMQLPFIQLSPYEIFSNTGEIFSVNLFKDNDENQNQKQDKNIFEEIFDIFKENDQNRNRNQTILDTTRSIVGDWYTTLRLIAIVGMMSVLVYIGIRILISSTVESKAKYKQMIIDWMVAMFLIFVMHYIMVFANLLVESVTDVISSITVKNYLKDSNTIEIDGVEGFLIGAKGYDGENPQIDDESTSLVQKAYKKVEEGIGNESMKEYGIQFYTDATCENEATSDGDAKVLFWPANNFTTQARFYASLYNEQDGKTASYRYIGYGLIYVFLTIFTLMFIYVYLRRFIYMVFLTLIAPLVALTYPIDKVKDGQAQAFNYWFREYMYNLLLQPLHLLLYEILVGMAMQFAAKNPIYVLVCLGFLIPAEKLLKEMFGFKGKTPGSPPGLATGALMMVAAKKIFDGGNKSQKNNSNNGNNGGNSGGSSAPYKTHKPGSNIFNTSSGGFLPGGSGGSSPGGSGGSSPGGSGRFSPGGSGRFSPGGSGGSSKKRKISIPAPARAIGRGIKNRWIAKGGLKGLGKSTAKFAGRTLGIGIGAATGIASTVVAGDPSKFLENVGVASAGFGKFFSIATDNVISASESFNEDVQRERVLDKMENDLEAYKKEMNEKYSKEWRKKQENIDTLELNRVRADDQYYKQMSAEASRRGDQDEIRRLEEQQKRDEEAANKQYEELMKGGKLELYHSAGITDAKDIAALEQLLYENRENGWQRDDVIAVGQRNKQIANGEYFQISAADREAWNRELDEQIGRNQREQTIKILKKFNDMKKNLN